ncbi:MAG: GNAT family N-acetyltransferase [Dyadobacter sp.]|uniref:GNAT family N-acetyltransferase n=1 Tax=Dyadobacter sp. TaxID=1914288 RepID=UPI001B2E5F92|nr:GNAT family N-acetyltransferase [Dyadobacter sp.]MBO9616035.1 GNAT family N-acetyltransferase [Dyadobacter sp.]
MVPKPILLSREQIDARTWDNHIHHSRQCVIYALSWYLDIVCEQWEALVWPTATDYSIVMPLPVRRKFGRRVLYQPLFCQYLGVFSKHELTAEQCGAFLQALTAHFPYISNYSFNPENFAVIGKPCLKSFEWELFQTHWLNLNQPYGELYAGYSGDRKANLRRGSKTAWEIVESEDFGPLIALFTENHAAGIGRIKADAYMLLRRLGMECVRNAHGCLVYAQAGGHVRAGVFLTRYRGRTIYLFNAADRAGRRGNARALVLDAYFRENAGRKLIFDFESPPKVSIADYYAGYGAVAMPFWCVKRNTLPFPFRQMQRLRKWLIRTRQYLFSALCRILNPFPANRF